MTRNENSMWFRMTAMALMSLAIIAGLGGCLAQDMVDNGAADSADSDQQTSDDDGFADFGQRSGTRVRWRRAAHTRG